MVNKFFTCPYCHKETSYWFESASNNIILSSYSVGFGYLLKKECDFCKGSLSINWFHYLLCYLILFSLLVLIWLTCKFIYMHGISEDFKQVVPLIVFFLFLPIAVLFFYLIFPSIVSMMGLRLYFKKDNLNKEAVEKDT